MTTRSYRTTLAGARRRMLAVAILAALLGPAIASAQDEFTLDEPTTPPPDPERVAELTEIRNWVEVGAGWVSDDSFRFGRYTGLEDEGWFGVLDFEWYRRAPYDGDDAGYCRIQGSDLGLESREMSVEFGRQGDYRVRLEYDQTPFFRSDSAQTIFDGAGGTNLTLPAGWVGAQNTAGMTRLLPSLGPIDIESERRSLGIEADKRLHEKWEVSASYRHEDKDGTKTIGGVIGNSGGNPRAVLLPEPIDYTTQEIEAAVRYTDAKFQFEGRYYGSLFDDDNSALKWQNPYTAINGWAAAAGFPTGFGQTSLPPDNEFHQLSLAGGYDFSERTRVTADVAIGRMTQDDSFLPYTVNPVLAASITQPLPRNSLDGEIDTTVANLRVTSRPTDRLYWTALLRYDDRDNQTPRDEYVYIGGDSQTQVTAPTSSFRRYNEPYSYEEKKFRAEAGYRLGDDTRLSGSAERRDIDRTYSERENAKDDTFQLALNQDFAAWFSGSLRATFADRDGSTYVGNEPFLSGYDPRYTSTVPGQFENPPGLRKYHEADRERTQYGVLASITPGEFWSIGLDLEYADDDYDSSEIGLTSARIDSYSVDVAYAPSTRWSAYAFYSYEDLSYDQNGQSIGGATRVADSTNPARSWRAEHDDRVDSAGAGLTWNVIEDRLDVGLDYVWSLSEGEIDVSTGSALTSRPLPPNKTKLNSLGVHAKYRLRTDLYLRLGWLNEALRSSDFALDGVEANQLANVITLGETSPDYDVDVVTLSLIARF